MSRATAVVFTAAGYVALLVAGLGIGSLVSGAAVIATRGLGVAPGIAAVAASVGAFALLTASALRPERPSYATALWVALGAYVSYLLVLGIAVAAVTGDLAVALSVPGALAVGWQGLVVLLAAAVAAWCAVALRRTRAARPRWPWEDDEDDAV